MRHLFRTIVGKTFLFLMCLFSTCALILGVIGVIGFGEEGIYSRSKESFYEEYISHTVIDDFIFEYNLMDREDDEIVEFISTGNLILTVKDDEGDVIACTKDADKLDKEPYSFRLSLDFTETVTDWSNAYLNSIYVYYNGDTRYTASYMRPFNSKLAEEYDNLTLIAEFKAGLPVYDSYRLKFKLIDAAYGLRTLIFPICLGLGLIALCSFIALMCVSGRRRGDEELHPGHLTVVPFDVMLILAFSVIVMFIGMIDMLGNHDLMIAMLLAAGSPLILSMLLGCCMSLAVRIKGNILISGLFITKVLKFIWKILCFIGIGIKKFVVALPLAWKSLLVLFADFLINAIAFGFGVGREPEFGVFLLIIKSIAAAVFVAYMASKIKKLQTGAKALADGDLAYRIDSTGMLPNLKEHADMLNSISQGMGAAVEQRMKSERMKTELITNVSHDIKTPLTSIINYVGLIANEECDNEKHAEYTEVLVRQSKKLKRLIEDLVEASKASTGNLEVHPAPCDASVLLSQVSGEYEERLNEAGLSLIVKQCEEPLTIMADGRHMWRIFDNLMNNICKYSLAGSRVYLTLERDGNNARFLFKNTSREVLDISEEELMERFVRGDSSRNTEGNGLGLSIAKSLAQLRNGDLRIETDGDLFKAIMRFPITEYTGREPEGYDMIAENVLPGERYTAERNNTFVGIYNGESSNTFEVRYDTKENDLSDGSNPDGKDYPAGQTQEQQPT